ncbi:MAG: hypothetical protein WJU30_00559 [Candidatus Phytoplasma pruni]
MNESLEKARQIIVENKSLLEKIVHKLLKKPLTKKSWKIYYNETTYKRFFIIVKIIFFLGMKIYLLFNKAF